MPSTDSFTSSATVVAAGSGAFTNAAGGAKTFSTHGFLVRSTAAGITASKAATLGGTQVNIPWPLSRDNARELALALLQIAT